MKTRPILFNGPMVRAVLSGQKTQTRRIVKVRGLDFVGGGPKDGPDWNDPSCWGYEDLSTGQHWALDKGVMVDHVFPCPYGQPGDRLWVRESFWGCDLPGHGDHPCAVYDDEWHGKDYRPTVARPWARKFGRIPSIHMPRDCSRITLEVTGVRVERLWDISDEDATAEGISRHDNYPSMWKRGPLKGDQNTVTCTAFPRLAFRSIWESINGAGSWAANPWVWVIEFRRAEP